MIHDVLFPHLIVELVHEHWLGVPQPPDLERHLRGHGQEHGGEEPVPADGPGDGIYYYYYEDVIRLLLS